MSTERAPSISAFVVCCNERDNIARCLKSILWCDEIIVIDSGSTDGTVEICKSFPVTLIQRPWPGYVEQKRFGLKQCTSDWVLNIDADEEVSPALRDEVQSTIRDDGNHLAGYEVPRVVFHLGKWWRKGGWHPEFRLRLMRREAASWDGDDPHEHAVVNGAVGRLQEELRHFTYRDIEDQVRSLNVLSSAAAKSLLKKGIRVSLVAVLLRPPIRFLKFYFVRQGFREGVPGLLVAVLDAVYVFLKYAKAYSAQRFGVGLPPT